MNRIYFEEKGEALLERIGMPKAEFARRMGIQRQKLIQAFYAHWKILNPESAILRESVLDRELAPKQHNANQKQFQKMLQMRHNLPGIGRVKLMVGVKRSDKMKVQYCITAIEPVITKARQPR